MKMGDTTVRSLLENIHSYHSDTDLFERTFKHKNVCKDIVQCDKDIVMIENEFRLCNLQKHVALFTGLAVDYKRDVIKVSLEQFSLDSPKIDFKFRLAHNSFVHQAWQNHPVNHPYLHNVYNTVRLDVMKDIDQDVYCVDDLNGTPSSFVGFVRVFSDETTTSLNSTNLVTNPVHAILPTCSVTYREWTTENGLFY